MILGGQYGVPFKSLRTVYKPWGEVRHQSGALPTDYTYTGQYSHTADFGLMYYNARWYDPALGRFAQADTIIPGAGNPMAWDRYAYTLNNPVKYTDPSGHDVCFGGSPGSSCKQGGGGMPYGGGGTLFGSGGGVPNGFTLYGSGARAGTQVRGFIIRVGGAVAIDYGLHALAGRNYTKKDAATAALFSLTGGKASSFITDSIGKLTMSQGKKYLMLLGGESLGNIALNTVERDLSGGENTWDTFKIDVAIGTSTAILGYHLSNTPLPEFLGDDWGEVLPTIQSDTYSNVLNSIGDVANPSSGGAGNTDDILVD